MSYEATGTVKQINQTQVFDSGFQKRLMIMSIQDGDYTNDLAVEAIKDKVSMYDQLSIGQEVKVNFNIRSNEGKPGMWFTNATAWRVEPVGGQQPAQTAPQHQMQGHPMPQGGQAPATVEDDSVPF